MKTQKHWTLPAWLGGCLGLLPLPAQAQYIHIRVSAKFILSPTGARANSAKRRPSAWRPAGRRTCSGL
jgi:hypothetical protein